MTRVDPAARRRVLLAARVVAALLLLAGLVLVVLVARDFMGVFDSVGSGEVRTPDMTLAFVGFGLLSAGAILAQLAFAGPLARRLARGTAPAVGACPACGTERAPDAAFCPGCGARLARTCPACGRAGGADARYCEACGAAFQA